MFLRTSQALLNKMPSSMIPGKMFTKFFASAGEVDNKNNLFNFTDQEHDRILDLVNSKPMDDLARYAISKAKLTKFEAWKSKHGSFQDISDILQIESFSVKIAEKFYKSLLKEEPAKKPSRKPAPFVIPKLPTSQAEQINSSVSLHVGVSNITWSRLELNQHGSCNLTHWDHHDINEKKIHLHDLIDRCLYVEFLIPQADCYIFENPQIAQSSAPGSAEQLNINVQRAQLLAILGYALATRNTSVEHSQPNVFYLKRFLAARLFQQLIGTERVSAEKAILGLMRTKYNIEDSEDGAKSFSGQGYVDFPANLRTVYKEAERYNRELLGQTLLLNLAFMKLVLLKDAKALALVGSSTKNIET